MSQFRQSATQGTGGLFAGLRFGWLIADLESMEVLVSLQYPNGRIYETSYPTAVELGPGSEFDLHGRHWQVVGMAKQRRWGGPQPPLRTLCVSTGARSLPRP